MILFDDWTIQSTGGLLARQYDNLSRQLVVTGVPEGYDWTVLVRHGDNADELALEPMKDGVGLTLTAQQLAFSGYYQLQLVGTLQSDGVTTRHTNVLREFVPESLSGDANWPERSGQIAQLEAEIAELRQQMETLDMEAAEGKQGPAGADGKTPVRGVDYFTDEDKAELVQDVLARLESAEEVKW